MNQYWIIGLIASWIVTGFAGWEAASWRDGLAAAHLAEQQQANTIKAEDDVIVKEHKAEDITTKVETDYDKKIESIGANYDSLYKLPTDDTTGSRVPVIPKAASGTDVVTYSNKCPESSKTALLKLAKACDKQAQQLMSLQDWVREQAK